MTLAESQLDHEALIQILRYDLETGVFFWKAKIADKVVVGNAAGSLRAGYVVIRINKLIYRAHRLAWFYVHGTWPMAEIDHRNGVRDDNRIANLREATSSQNKWNSRMREHNESGFKGVRKNGRRGFMARIRANGVSIYLGTFRTPEEASAAYAAASHCYHGEYGRRS